MTVEHLAKKEYEHAYCKDIFDPSYSLNGFSRTKDMFTHVISILVKCFGDETYREENRLTSQFYIRIRHLVQRLN